MDPSKSSDDVIAEEILRAALFNESNNQEDAVTENTEWLNARMSECYND